jgi:hypothetical protein
MNEIFSCIFPNQGFIGCTFSDNELLPIIKEIEEMQLDFNSAEPFNNGLVGHIEKEYLLKKSHKALENLVLPLVPIYQKKFGRADNLINKEFKLTKTWVNFQKKYEFNPVHNHPGIYSFVLWIKIPYTVEEENKYFPVHHTDVNRSGRFSFTYLDVIGQLHSWVIPADKTYEKRLILWPSQLSHEVFPFYSSDEYRISISGNLEVK